MDYVESSNPRGADDIAGAMKLGQPGLNLNGTKLWPISGSTWTHIACSRRPPLPDALRLHSHIQFGRRFSLEGNVVDELKIPD
jgi:hypothetical protein